MTIPSFEDKLRGGKRGKPSLYIVEVRDREKPDQGAIAWLWVERVEHYRNDELDRSVYEASVTLHYERIFPKHSGKSSKGYFVGGYSRLHGPSVSLTSSDTSKGAVFLDLPGLEGQRIGTYLMNEIVTWVQQWPDATVRPIELREEQSHGENKARRNRFYEQFGLIFDYSDPECKEGLSRQIPAGALTPVETWKENIVEHDVRDYLGALLNEKDKVSQELYQRELAVKSLLSEVKRAENNPLRWAVRQLWWRYAPSLVVLATVASLGTIVWFKYLR